MILSPGSRLGVYEVLSHIGSGGMGQVYRARDTRLGREVAIKVLPADVGGDRERLARFRREAQVLASLNHPRIAAIHGLEEENGAPFLVLELVPGEDLSALLSRGALPLDEALEIARQIAEGLEGAHEAGVMHRDLKPANVKITPDGAVKLLDFGLAKAWVGERTAESGSDLSHSPTVTSPSTELGVILGTAAYMAPEQARGKAVDKRADVWAFGVVLHEMLTGKRLFAGETVTDTLAAVLTKEIDLDSLPASTPERVRALVRRCLTRDRKQRMHDAGDARLEIEEAQRERSLGTTASSARADSPARRSTWLAPALAAAALALGLVIGRGLPRRAAPLSGAFHGPLRAVVPLPPDVRLDGWGSPVIALSPDGRMLAFVGEKPGAGRQLWVHDLSRGESRLVPGSESAEGPFFSPDGDWIAFATGTSEMRVPDGPRLMRFSLRTGLTEPLAPLEDYFGGWWARDGSISLVSGEQDGLFRLPAGAHGLEHTVPMFKSGGTERKRKIKWPQLLPSDRSLLVTDWRGRANTRVSVLDPATRELSDLGVEGGIARWIESGHLLFVRRDGTLMAVPFDLATRKTRGAAFAVLGGVSSTGNDAAVLAVSETGTLAYASGYIRGSSHELSRLVRIAPGVSLRPLPFEPQELFHRFAVSPAGDRAAVIGWDGDLWILDVARGTRSKVPGVTAAESVVWSPDGRSIGYNATANEGLDYEVRLVPADGSAPPRKVPFSTEEAHVGSFSPDGHSLIVDSLFSRTPGIWALATDGSKPPAQIIAVGEKEPIQPVLSPDGRLLAYAASDTGRLEITVRALDGGGAVAASTAGGSDPHWARDGGELYFRQGDSLMAVRVSRSTPGGRPSVGPPEKIAELPEIFAFDTTPTTREFIALQRVPGTGIVTEIRLVVGLFDELRRLTGKVPE